MTRNEKNAVNQTAYLNLRKEIDRVYPKGRFVAIDDGRVIADAPTFDALESRLVELGRDSPEVLVVLSGDETPDYLEIL
jgi:hypothetical protein